MNVITLRPLPDPGFRLTHARPDPITAWLALYIGLSALCVGAALLAIGRIGG